MVQVHSLLCVSTHTKRSQDSWHMLNLHAPLCRVLVMDKGRALEYGRPAELLENDEGAFTGRQDKTAASPASLPFC